jgi:3-oxoacyl-[acyl-carrier protein] reductase
MTKLDGKVAVITGSGRGIGRALALKLAAEGARVVVNDIDEGPAAETVAAIRDMGGVAAICAGGITDPAFPERFIRCALTSFDGLDIIVNNAGFPWANPIEAVTDEQFATMLDVHIVAPFRILRAAGPHLQALADAEAAAGREVFRKVVNISSLAGVSGAVGLAGYGSGKAAIVGLTKTLAKEWGPRKVNVNCVAFGYIRTRLSTPVSAPTTIDVAGATVPVGIPEGVVAIMESQMIPLGRGGTPEDAAGGVYLFCIPESDYITGQVLIVGGGLTL